MYDDLVKKLRWLVFMFPETHPEEDDTDRISNNIHLICQQAADAIEELSKKYLQAEIDATNLTEWLADEHAKHLWIPVTEKPPKAYEDVLLRFPNNQAAGFCDRDDCWGVYSGDGFYTEVADNEPKPTHWAKKLPEPPKGEA